MLVVNSMNNIFFNFYLQFGHFAFAQDEEIKNDR